MPALTITATGGAALTAIQAISAINLLTVSFPGLNFLSNGAPTSNSISNIVEKTNQLETPSHLHSYLQKNQINQPIDKKLEKSILNAEKAKKHAEETLEEYRLIFTVTGINLKALSRTMKNKRKTEKHYNLAMKNTKSMYKEITKDLLEEHQKLSFLGADTNYTGPITQIHEKTKEIIKNLNREKCGDEKDISTTVGCLTKDINTYRNTTGEFTPSLYNKITQTLIPKYSELKKQINKKTDNLKQEYRETEKLQKRNINKANEKLHELEAQKTTLINWNPGSTQKNQIETSIAGTPRQQLLKIKENQEESRFLAEKAENIKKSKKENYLVQSVKKYKKSLSKAEITYKESKNLLKRLRNIEKSYKDKIKKLRSQLKQTLTSRYWERIETRYKKSLQQSTYGERIKSLKNTYQYIKSIKNAEDKEIIPIKNKIQNLLKRIQKYQDLGYDFEDKIKKLKHLQKVKDPEMIPRTYEVYNEIKRLVEKRLTPLRQKIERKRQESSQYLKSAEELRKTPSTQESINTQLLKKLKQEHRETRNKPPLKQPKQTLKTYNKIINQIHTSIKQLKSKLLSKNTQIKTKTEKTVSCNQQIKRELTLTTKNPLQVPLYDTKITKTIKKPEEEINFYIPVLEPGQITQRTTTTTITPYRCNLISESDIQATENWITKMKKIKIERNVESTEVFITQYIPKNAEIIHLEKSKRTKKGRIKLNINSEQENITITYKKPPKLDIEGHKEINPSKRTQYIINIINNGDKISNFTLTRSIDPIGKIESNYPIEESENHVKITIPELGAREKIKMTYKPKSLKKEAKKNLMRLNQLNYTKDASKHLMSRLKEIRRLYRDQEYREVIEKSPNLINEFRSLPSKSKDNYTKDTDTRNESNKTVPKSEENELTTITQRTSNLCELIECRDLKMKLEELKSTETPQEKKITKLKTRLNNLEEEAMKKVKKNKTKIKETFKLLEKAFKTADQFTTENKEIPYTQEDLKSLQERKKSLNKKELVFGIAEPSFTQLVEEHGTEKIKRKIEKRKDLIEDAEDMLSNIKESSILRLERARKIFSKNKNEVTRKYLEKAKNYHEEGEYLNSMLSSHKVIQFTQGNSGNSLPLKYIAAGIIISGTTLYILKKPGNDEEDGIEDVKMKLKRGK